VRSFKGRGAVFRVSQLSEAERAAGVVTASTGNHGIAGAHAAHLLGTSVVVVIPDNADPIKLAPAAALGAELRHAGATLGEALGAGTIALEVLEELPEASVLLVPIGGGNLVAGIAACAKQINDRVTIIGVQSEAAPCVYESWKAGTVIRHPATTYAGGLAADYPGELSLRIITDHVDDIVLVSDDDLRRATGLALTEIGQALEGAGAAPLAAVERYHGRWSGEVVVAILSGGMASRDELEQALGLSSAPSSFVPIPDA